MELFVGGRRVGRRNLFVMGGQRVSHSLREVGICRQPSFHASQHIWISQASFKKHVHKASEGYDELGTDESRAGARLDFSNLSDTQFPKLLQISNPDLESFPNLRKSSHPKAESFASGVDFRSSAGLLIGLPV